MSFAEIALPLAALGIRVFPLQAGNKEPVADMRWKTEATTDPAIIEGWGLTHADSNVAMVADRDSVCFLEWDIANGMSAMFAEMQQPKPAPGWTRAQRSGRRYTHLIFTHTERSRAVGNRSVNLPDGCVCQDRKSKCCCVALAEVHHHHEWFSFRAQSKYLVGAGSLHPCGRHYETAWDVPPTPIPDWVCDWIESHSSPEPESRPPKDARPVSEDFDFDDFTDHCGVSVMDERPDNPWKVVDICPGVGRRHTNSTLTAFWWDGETVGWSCFAQSCPTLQAFQEGRAKSKIGSLLMFLKAEGNPYLGKIWDGDDATGFDVEAVPVDVDTVLDSLNLSEAPAPKPAEKATKPPEEEEICPRYEGDCGCGMKHLKRPKPAEAPPPKQPSPEPEPQAAEAEPAKAARLTTMREDCMYGWLGEFARTLGAPLGHAYTTSLAVFSGQSLISSTRGGVRGQVYAGLIAPKHEGKTRTMDRCLESLVYQFPKQIVRKYPGSEHGLITVLGGNKKKAKGAPVEDDQITRPWLLVIDELKWLFGKSEIKSSALPNALNDLFYHDYLGASVKGVDGQCWPRVSLVGGLTAKNPEDFSETFGKATESGLYDRFIFSVAERGWSWDDQWEATPELRFPKSPIDIPTEAFARKRDWVQKDRQGRGRLAELALRIAIITASANHESEVTPECMDAAIRYCEWQEAIRVRYCPSEMDEGDREGKCQEAIVRAFQRYKPEGGWVMKRQLCVRANLYRHSARRLNSTWDAMVKEGMLVEGQPEVQYENGEKTRKRSSLYRLVDDWDDSTPA